MRKTAVTTAGPVGHTGAMASESRWPLWVSLLIVLAVFTLRLPNVVQPMGPDQGVYTTIGWGLQSGLALYRDLWEQKPPGIYLTYLLGFVLFGSRTSSYFWMDYLAAALAVLFVFDIGRRLVTLRFGAVAAALAAIGTLPAARHGYGGFLERSVTETFVIPLAAAAAWCAVMAFRSTRDRWSFAAGVFIGVAAVYKQTALIYWPALAVWTWFVADAPRARRFASYAMAGLVIAPCLAFAWLWAEGVLGDAWIALVEYNLAYLAIGDHGFLYSVDRFAHEVWRRMKTDEVWAFGSLSAFVAVLAWRRRSTSAGQAALLGIAWLGAALTATLANGPRFFTTYFMPSLVPLSLLSAWLIHQTLALGRREKAVAVLLLVVFTGAMLARSGSATRFVDATSWDTRYLFGHTTRQEYLDRFRSRATKAFSAADNDRLADYIRTRTEPDDRIFVFGMTAGTYFTSRRLPASRFLWAYPAVSNMVANRPEFRVETLAAELARTSPRYIVLQRHNGDSFSGWRAAEAFEAPPLAALISSSYRLETTIGDFVLYRKDDL
ncbi:MAG TPA: glycosyltransferase family 39 protein [Vicinamibacterales bacterium]|nr:glycosyltransferase family 39 protein [Vicinamibacterales bacterium]